MKESNRTYWLNISMAVRTLSKGLGITFGHILQSRKSKKSVDIQDVNYFAGQQGIATIQYPHEHIPVPDNGRYKLHNEIDDCIVCDKCAKVCPVNCITIEPIKSATEFGRTSDDTPKRIYAAKFDIDMGKCCFCGLCTTVCPTECLTMTKEFDFTTFDMAEHNFAFANLSPQEAQIKQQEWEASQKAKQVAAAATAEPSEVKPATTAPTAGAKPVFKPRIKPPSSENKE